MTIVPVRLVELMHWRVTTPKLARPHWIYMDVEGPDGQHSRHRIALQMTILNHNFYIRRRRE